jgi:hypothetical protein
VLLGPYTVGVPDFLGTSALESSEQFRARGTDPAVVGDRTHCLVGRLDVRLPAGAGVRRFGACGLAAPFAGVWVGLASVS